MTNDSFEPAKDATPFYLCYLPKGLDRLNNYGEIIQVPMYTQLNTIDTVPEYCYLVKKGRVICYDITENGNRHIYSIFEQNSLMLEECMLFQKPCHVVFMTIQASSLLRIGRCALKSAFKHDLDIVLDYCEYQSIKFLSQMEMSRLSQHKSIEWRVCKILQTFMEHYGVPSEGRIIITEHITQQMIADILGVNRVTVTHIFKNLRNNFLDQINGKYSIRSAELLQKYMDKLI